MKFNEICASNELTTAMATIVVSKSPLLASYIQFFQKPGDAVSFRTNGAGSAAGATRVLDGVYEGQTMKPTYGVATRKMLGGVGRMDVARENMGYDIPSEMQAQLKLKMAEFGRKFNYQLIKGDPDTTAAEFAGLNQLVSDSRIISMGTNGAIVTLGSDNAATKAQQSFMEKVNETIAMCEGDNKVIIANAATIARLTSIGDRCISIERNEFGTPIAHFNLVPIINIGDYINDEDVYGSILGRDETIGTSSDCASLYVASFGEQDGVSFATCKDGFKVYDMQKVGQTYECMYELIADSALVRASALSKLEGIRF